ncbi:hypothetical protein TREES_T100014260 [Tupaia chinensis]|uniref:Uncharacterized protein n=1 Tax=Tupaia chinensis TaxID=246437 RepID=L9JIF2_TUPCH|nr:hypothetical protein TREES_T100014260 [Tupaia chinensis]
MGARAWLWKQRVRGSQRVWWRTFMGKELTNTHSSRLKRVPLSRFPEMWPSGKIDLGTWRLLSPRTAESALHWADLGSDSSSHGPAFHEKGSRHREDPRIEASGAQASDDPPLTAWTRTASLDVRTGRTAQRVTNKHQPVSNSRLDPQTAAETPRPALAPPRRMPGSSHAGTHRQPGLAPAQTGSEGSPAQMAPVASSTLCGDGRPCVSPNSEHALKLCHFLAGPEGQA